MPFQVIPRELEFFDLFDRHADGMVRAVVDLGVLLSDLPNAGHHAERIRTLEEGGDELTHQIIGTVNRTFVTPFDRNDIHALASAIDDVLDSAEGLADLLALLPLSRPLPQFVQQIDVLQRAAISAALAVRDLRALAGVEAACADVKRAEREGDWIYRRGVAVLYSGDFGAIEVLMWKDLLDGAEGAIDRCEDIANVIESVALKFA
ncbi:MAG TPA: DUF47 family protein [Actinomycetota bacterium]|nr:DUF47 family protein [Actinomycetota bacterium]